MHAVTGFSIIMIKVRHLFIVFLSFFLVSLVLTTPVHVLWHQVGDDSHSDVKVNALAGNLWRGQADLVYGSDRFLLDWSFRPAYLLRGAVSYDLAVGGTKADLQGQVVRSFTRWHLRNLDGFIDLAAANPALAQQRVTLAGHLWVDNLSLAWSPRHGRLVADGNLNWRNGQSRFVWMGRPQEVRLPLIQASVSTDNAGLVQAQVTDATVNRPLADLELDAELMAMYRIYTHIREVLNVNLPGGRDIIMESRVGLREYLL